MQDQKLKSIGTKKTLNIEKLKSISKDTTLMYGIRVHARPKGSNPQGQKMHFMLCHILFSTFWYTIQGIHIIYKTSPQIKCMQHKRGLLNLCALMS
jgi:hypothetical protein